MTRTLLKNGFVIDGGGGRGYLGDVLLEDFRIKCVSKGSLKVNECEIIDCTGKVIAPGFIDAHSHNDQTVYFKDDLTYLEPFIRQGITTFVVGNCGYSVAGMAGDHLPTLHVPNDQGIGPWKTYQEYFDYMRGYGMRQNMVMLAGHGTALASVVGLAPTGATSPENLKKVEAILEEGLDAGCKGISFGLGYPLCKYITDDEVRAVCDFAIRRNAVIGVHSRTLNISLPILYGDDYSEPHNIRWHREFIDRFRDTGAKLQISHLLFVGTSAWPTYDAFFEMFDDRVANNGIDLWFDMYNYAQGATNVGLLLMPYFYDNIDTIYGNPQKIAVLQKEMEKSMELKGYPPSMMQMCNAYSVKYKRYQG
jgi:N-acyl-D-amino-acid deacylase